MTPRFGPLLTADGTHFRLWAPAAKSVALKLDTGPRPMTRQGDWYEISVPDAGAGTRYRFTIDGELDIPDPASHFQPDDVHGPSEVIDHRYAWRCADWKGRPWAEAVFSEVHVGTYTPAGTFAGIVEKLDHLVETGITALELMPLADFPGRWNWGYDGVLLYAPDSAYGRPDDLRALIDAAHERGLMVFLDVVYNHFGPDGNYLGRIAPQFFSDAQTPWGGAIDYRVPDVRAYAIGNALHWLDHYRFDGLRLDAVHAIVSDGETAMLHDLSKAVGALARETGRHIHLVLENDDNRAALLAPDQDPPQGSYRAQWNDDYHHAWHVYLTGEKAGYYRDYDSAPRHVARTLTEGFGYQGEASPHRQGAPRGEPSGGLPPTAFVNFIQNHDQIGNRPLGERLTRLAAPAAVEAALTVLLLQPGPPLLFMGEEWGADEPFPFFCDFTGDLAEAVRQGRRREFAEAYADHGGEIPDPLSPDTPRLARLDWQARGHPAQAARLDLTRRLLRLRADAIVPLIPAIQGKAQAVWTDGVLAATWPAGDHALQLLANLTGEPQPRPALRWGRPLWQGAPPATLPAWSVYAAIGDA